MKVVTALFALAIAFPIATASAEATPYAVPAMTTGKSGLSLEIVQYDGSTNGKMLVRVRNPGKKAATFRAEGLTFIPMENPDEAPQRLGAVGPFWIASDTNQEEQAKLLTSLSLAPGVTKTLRLEVFCIDAGRASPTNATQFSLAKKRLPANLRSNIEKSAHKAAQANGGYGAASRDAIQSEVWRNRKAAPTKFEGDGAQERQERQPHNHNQAPNHMRHRLQELQHPAPMPNEILPE